MKSDPIIQEILSQIPLYLSGQHPSKPWSDDFFLNFDLTLHREVFSPEKIETLSTYSKLKSFYSDYADYLIRNKQSEKIEKIISEISLSELPDVFLYKMAAHLFASGEIFQTKKLIEYLINFSLDYATYDDLGQLKQMIEEVPVQDETKFYYYLLSTRFDSLVDFYEKIYSKFFLRNKVDESYLKRFLLVKEKTKSFSEDYRVQFIFQDIEMIENIKITIATGLLIPFQSKKNLLVYSVIAKSISAVFFQTTLIYFHFAQRENVLKKILKYKKIREVVAQAKNNRMINFLREQYLDTPMKQPAQENTPVTLHTLDHEMINLFKGSGSSDEQEEMTKVYRLNVDFLSENMELRNLIENMQYEKAVEYLEKRDSNRDKILKASLLLKLKRYSEMIDLLEELKTENLDEMKEILYLQALAYQKLKMNELAKDLFKKLHSLDPHYKLANVKIHEI